MEHLLHYVWRHKIFPLRPLATTTGLPVEVVDPGLPNADAGPDFFNAKVRIDGTLWVGNVEIHRLASDWFRHGHDRDAAYANVVLHVVERADGDVPRPLPDGGLLPQLELECPADVAKRYHDLSQADDHPPCHATAAGLPRLAVHAWFAALQAERLERKAADIGQRLARLEGNWEDAFFVTLARNFGFGLNGDAFEAWASALPLRAADKHRDNLFQLEALFFGRAGLLDDEPTDEAAPDDYRTRLQAEYRYLCRKFELQPAATPRWRLLRLRPGNFPHVRLAQLAWLYAHAHPLLSRVAEAPDAAALRRLLSAGTSDYWTTHYLFGHPSPRRAKRVGTSAQDLLIINTVVPFLYAYGRYKADDSLCERAARLLDGLRPEDNHITRQWMADGLPVENAADSQALVQLSREYCDRRDCLRCRFGYEYLKQRK